MGMVIGIWVIVIILVLLNGFAAGVAAALHVWRSGQPRRSRAVTAAGITGLLPLVMVFPAAIEPAMRGTASVVGLIIGFIVLCGLSMAVSLPGAVIIARKLDGPGNAYQAFE